MDAYTVTRCDELASVLRLGFVCVCVCVCARACVLQFVEIKDEGEAEGEH